MTKPPQRPPRRRKKKEPLAILILALLVALVAWPFEKLFGRGGGRGRGRARLVVVLVVGIVLALLVAAVAFDAASTGDTIHRNITVDGVAVGGLTVAQATQKLETVALRGGGVTLSWSGRQWRLTAAELHARLRAKVAAGSAFAYTRTGNFMARGWRGFTLLFASHPVAASVTFAEPATRERLDAIAQTVDVKPVQGAVSISGSRSVARAASNGRAVERAAVVRLLADAALSGRQVSAALPVVTVAPVVSTADAQQAAATATAWLAGPLRLVHGGHTWTISRQDLGQYLAFVHQSSEPHLRVTFDSPVTRGYFDFITQQVGRPGRNATFTTTAGGRHVRIKHGSPGYGVVPKATIANMDAAAAAGGGRIAQAVFGKAPPTLSDAEARALHISTRIGTYTTAVAGTSNRLTNVSLGSSLHEQHADRARQDLLGERHHRRAHRGQGLQDGAHHHQRQAWRHGRRRHVPGLDDGLQRCLRGRPADRRAPQPRALHRALPAGARRDRELRLLRPQVPQRHTPLDPAQDELHGLVPDRLAVQCAAASPRRLVDQQLVRPRALLDPQARRPHPRQRHDQGRHSGQWAA